MVVKATNAVKVVVTKHGIKEKVIGFLDDL